MGLSVGIVGLPNVGKSTTFNALTKASNAQAANYPFCTIEPNSAIVAVPDPRLEELAKIVKPNKIIHSSIEFVDIAGLVKGASKGEGLGNKFLSNIKQTDLILHIVRCFDDKNITHVQDDVDPIRDIETIQTELVLADIEQLIKKHDKLLKENKAKHSQDNLIEFVQDLIKHLDSGKTMNSFSGINSEMFENLNKELRLLSAKEVIFCVNVKEDELSVDNQYVKKVKEYAKKSGFEVVKICAKIEEELIGLSKEDVSLMLNSFGVNESGLEKIIQLAFKKLKLISYFTAGVVEVRAWTIHKGYKAPKAASVIHNDFERGFIRAEVISYDDYISCGSELKAKETGKMRLEGKDYIVNDGDVMYFRFNV